MEPGPETPDAALPAADPLDPAWLSAGRLVPAAPRLRLSRAARAARRDSLLTVRSCLVSVQVEGTLRARRTCTREVEPARTAQGYVIRSKGRSTRPDSFLAEIGPDLRSQEASEQ